MRVLNNWRLHLCVVVALILLAGSGGWAQLTLGSTGSITTAGVDCATATACVAFFPDGNPSFGIYLDVGTSGTFNFEVSQNATTTNGGTWTSVEDSEAATSAMADGSYYFKNHGFRLFRVRASAISGAATVNSVTGYAFNTDGASGAAGAPTDATYITQTADATLSAEQAIGALASGIMRVATTTGVVTSLTDSAGLFANISDETGAGALVGGTSPTITTPQIEIINNTSNLVGVRIAAGANINATVGFVELGTPSMNITGASSPIRVGINTSGYAIQNTAGTVTELQVGFPTSVNPSDTSTMIYRALRLNPLINYSNGTPGTGWYEVLSIGVIETALPTGNNYLIRAAAGAAGTTDRFTVDNAGVVQAFGGYKSADGTTGATVTSCTGFKNGLCISGT